jgi:transcriptional regulator with XRE-family HTH domain
MSQEDVARAIDVRALAVGKWERGQANPSIENRIKLAELFKVEPAEFGVQVPGPAALPDSPPQWFVAWQADQQEQLREIREMIELLINR